MWSRTSGVTAASRLLRLKPPGWFKARLLPSMHGEVHRGDLASQAALPRRMAGLAVCRNHGLVMSVLSLYAMNIKLLSTSYSKGGGAISMSSS